MAKFSQGQMIVLKSNRSVEGAVIAVLEGSSETRYQVFTNSLGMQTYYESQIEAKELEESIEEVDGKRFHAGLTASLIRNPSLSSLYSLNTARIDLIPHQFRPVLKFIRSDRPRLLIADGVGVGKTIEAGLILKELEARRNINSVLIICPRPLITERKWEKEMKRFDEEFVAVDGEKLRYCINELYMEGEWPSNSNKVVMPYSLFDKNNIYGVENGRRDQRGLMNVDPPKFDLVIVDEAHHIRNTDTFAYKAVSRFVDNAEAVLFLTATPVQLEYDDLFVLLNLLRPDYVIDKNAFHEMAEPNLFINQAAMLVRGRGTGWQKEALEQINQACNTSWGRKVYTGNPEVARIKELLESTSISHEDTVQLISDIEGLHTFSNIISRTRRRDIGEFTVRDPHTVTVDFTPAQRELHDTILQITHEMLSQIHSTDNTKFMMTTIRRQTASCLFGLVPLLKDMLFKHVFELMEEEDFLDSLLEDGKDDSLLMRDRINQIIELAEKLPKDDPKFDAMLKVVREKQATQQQKIMIFSSFRHTLSYLYEKLVDAGFRVGMIHGGVSDNDRLLLRERFDPSITNPEDKNALDIMLFSEVGTEGLDYQFCDCMINYDLPWNPMRVEQRIGRIDRTGQKSPKVNIYNLITPNTVDADIYERCLMRVGVFQASVGDCEEILGEVTKELKDIASDFEMSEEDRRKKLQQMTDNKVRFIKEQEELEEKQRDLFGIRVSKDAFDKELEEATNFWLSSEMIQNLIVEFLSEILGKDSEFILGEKEIKTLRLSQEARTILLDDLKRHKYKKNEIHRNYEKFLKGADQFWTITFDVESSKSNKDAQLITLTHPLVKQAADYLQSKGKHVTKLTVKTDRFTPGEYPFAVYQWKMVGDKTDIDIKTISENEDLNQILFELLKDSKPADHTANVDSSAWERIEAIHHDIWEGELAEHKRKTLERIKYKEASLYTSHSARVGALKDQLKNAKNDVSIKLTEGKLNVALADYERHLAELQQAKEEADILFELLAYGILQIEA